LITQLGSARKEEVRMSKLTDRFPVTADSLGRVGAVIAPGNTDLPHNTKGVVCLTEGDLTVVPDGNADDDTLSFVGVPAGFIPPYVIRRVTAATATVATIQG
jgi:hypothetical protein